MGIEVFSQIVSGAQAFSIGWHDLNGGLSFFTNSYASLVILNWVLIGFANSDPVILI